MYNTTYEIEEQHPPFMQYHSSWPNGRNRLGQNYMSSVHPMPGMPYQARAYHMPGMPHQARAYDMPDMPYQTGAHSSLPNEPVTQVQHYPRDVRSSWPDRPSRLGGYARYEVHNGPYAFLATEDGYQNAQGRTGKLEPAYGPSVNQSVENEKTMRRNKPSLVDQRTLSITPEYNPPKEDARFIELNHHANEIKKALLEVKSMILSQQGNLTDGVVEVAH